MTTLGHLDRQIDELLKQGEFIARRLQSLADERERAAKVLERFGRDEDYAVGTVITFEKQFTPNGKWYYYAAIKTPYDWPTSYSAPEVNQSRLIAWFTSGPKSPGPYTWGKLCEFMVDARELYIVTQMEQLV
jgi:hypothetical protein